MTSEREATVRSSLHGNIYDPDHQGVENPVPQPFGPHSCETLEFGPPLGIGGIKKDKPVGGNGLLEPPGS